MNKILKIVAIIYTIVLFIFAGQIDREYNNEPKLYGKSGYVTIVNYKTDTVGFIDTAGNLWYFKGIEDWQAGDHIVAVMNDNGTPKVNDDIIVNVKYERERWG